MLLPALRASFIRTFLSFILFVFLSPVLVGAAATDILITEINYDPSGADGDKEWIEIYNSGTESATLVGGSSGSSWKLYDGSNHNFSTSASKGSMTLGSGEYAVVVQDDGEFISKYPDYSGSIIKSSGMSLGNSLHDDEETVALRIGTSGSLWSQIKYKKSWGGSGNGRTLEKKDIAGVNDSTNWVESPVDGGTPGKPYSLPSYPSGIYLSEYMPDPETGNEWAEIYNENEDSKNLSGWQIDDVKNGGGSPKSFTLTVAGRGYIKIDLGTKTFFNNDGDSVRLLKPDGSVSEETSYLQSYSGHSFAKDTGGNWQETTKSTPGEVNVIDSPIHTLNISEIKKLTLGSRISTEAFITAPPDILGDNDFYVQDSTGGLRVHCSCSLSSDSFNLGDKVKVSSTIEESEDEKYIKTDNVTVLQKSQSQVEADEVGTGGIVEVNEGNLVRISGLVDHLDGNAFYLNDSSGLAKVYLKESTGVVRPKLDSGHLVRVIGLVSQSGKLKDGSANYRLLPRYKSDIQILSVTDEQLASGIGGQILGAVTQLPITGSNEDFGRFGFLLLFLGLDLRILLHNLIKK